MVGFIKECTSETKLPNQVATMESIGFYPHFSVECHAYNISMGIYSLLMFV